MVWDYDCIVKFVMNIRNMKDVNKIRMWGDRNNVIVGFKNFKLWSCVF